MSEIRTHEQVVGIIGTLAQEAYTDCDRQRENLGPQTKRAIEWLSATDAALRSALAAAESTSLRYLTERDDWFAAYQRAEEGRRAAERERDEARASDKESIEMYRRASSERDRLRDDYERACALVASMHAAAVGEVRGPDVGPVEDVAALRSALAAAERDAATWQEQAVRVGAELVRAERERDEARASDKESIEMYRRASSERDRLRDALQTVAHMCGRNPDYYIPEAKRVAFDALGTTKEPRP